jgi:integrase
MMDRYQLPIALMGWCALRFGETVALERADVDLVRRAIQIKKGVVRVEGERRLDTPKNRRTRVVHYPPHLDDMVWSSATLAGFAWCCVGAFCAPSIWHGFHGILEVPRVLLRGRRHDGVQQSVRVGRGRRRLMTFLALIPL